MHDEDGKKNVLLHHEKATWEIAFSPIQYI